MIHPKDKRPAVFSCWFIFLSKRRKVRQTHTELQFLLTGMKIKSESKAGFADNVTAEKGGALIKI